MCRALLKTLPLYSALALVVSGCAVLNDPSPIGRGYSSYAQAYKSAPGPDVPGLGYEYTAETNDEILAVWRVSVQDLLTRLEHEGGLRPGPVHVTGGTGAMNATFDHVLRDELTARGYSFSQNAPALGFDIDAPKGKFLSNESTLDKGYDKLHYRDFLLTLFTPQANVTDTYYLPAAGRLINKADAKATAERKFNP